MMAIVINSLTLVFIINSGLLLRATEATSSSRNHAASIAKQLGFGIKRGTYYLDTLIESCDSSDDLNGWLDFIASYLSCDDKAESTKLKQLLKEGHPHHRLKLVCKHWPLKRKCSSRLATKLNSCLGYHLEAGKAGTNAFRLADAHMKYLCNNRIEYSDNLITSSIDENEIEPELEPAEKRPLNCYRELEGPVNDCIIEMERASQLKTFCWKFQAAKECISRVYAGSCRVKATNEFMEIMLAEIEFVLEC